MATLQSINIVYDVRFHFNGQPCRRSPGISVREDAEDTKKQVEINWHRIEVNLIAPPPPGADVPLYVLTGVKEGFKPTAPKRLEARSARMGSPRLHRRRPHGLPTW